MTDNIKVHVDTSGLSDGLAEASAQINRVAREEIAPAAALIEDAFAGAARAIERELGRAAKSGALSLKSLLNNLRRVAIDSFVRKPIQNLLTNALTGAFGANYGGGRADGGLVAPGASYLVGERGPELFTPNSAGAISRGAGSIGMGGPVNVSINLPGVQNTESFRASQTQIAASLARVIARGRRNQ